MPENFQTIIFNVVIVGFALGSFSVVWRKMLNDVPSLKVAIMKNIPYPINRALTCGFCFTYWLSLTSFLVFNPLHGWLPYMHQFVPLQLYPFIYYGFSWMILGFTALFFRASFVIIQELMDYEMYTWNKQFHPIDPDHRH